MGICQVKMQPGKRKIQHVQVSLVIFSHECPLFLFVHNSYLERVIKQKAAGRTRDAQAEAGVGRKQSRGRGWDVRPHHSWLAPAPAAARVRQRRRAWRCPPRVQPPPRDQRRTTPRPFLLRSLAPSGADLSSSLVEWERTGTPATRKAVAGPSRAASFPL